jgi:multidrug resistance efflux pump
MKRKKLVLVLALALVAAAAFLAWRVLRREETFLLYGTVEANLVEVGSLIGGRVERVEVVEGAQVAAGQVLVILETDLLDHQIRQQEARVAEAKAAVERAERGPRAEEVRRARINWQAAETDRQRFANLLREGVVGRRDYDRAVVAEATARETYLELERGTRPEDVAAARAALAQADAGLAYLERQRRESVVTASVAGVVEALDLRPGDLVAPNQPVATLLEEGQLWVRVYVPEPRLGRVGLGQPAAVMVDSFPGREYRGQVVEIRDRGEYTPRNVQTAEQRGDLVFGVKVTLAAAPELKAGMAAAVRLLGDGAAP